MKATSYVSRLLSISVFLVIVLSLLPMQRAAALSPDIVISQVYGGGGNSDATYTHDFIELFNRGTVSVSLNGWSLQYASATGTGNFGSTATQITPLPNIAIAPGQYFLVQEAPGSGGTQPLPAPDATDSTPIAMSATGGKVAIVMSTETLGCNGGSTPCSAAQLALIKDLIGYGSANFYETAPAPAPANPTADIRNSAGCAETDNNSADFTVGSPTPRNTSSPLSACPTDIAPLVSSTTPANGASSIALAADVTVSFSEPVYADTSAFDLTCSVSGTHTFALSGGPTDFTLNPDTDFSLADSCTLTVYAAAVTDQDSDDPPDNMLANYSALFNTIGVCESSYTPTYSIQGSGMSAVITGTVTTQGLVVGDFEGSAAASGFYLQDLTGDGNSATSDGIFVFTGSANLVSAGDIVRVTGFARERFNQTALNGSNSNSSPVGNIINCGSGSLEPVDVWMPFESPTAPEIYEGMLVRFPQALTIAEYFNYDRFGEIVLGLPLDGENRLFTPTSVVEPGAPANDRAYQNSLRRITLDDAQSASNPPVLRHPNGDPFSLTNLFRGGDEVQNAIGVLGYDFSLYRIVPTGGAEFTAVNPRPAAPDEVGGSMQIAAMNTLNYFVTLDYPNTTPPNPLDNKCGPALNVECRGADADQPDEFTRQRTKLLQALVGLDASVIGLNEIENTTGVEPLADIVAGLNDLLGADTYAYIDTGVIGTDAIRVGLIYRPADVTPIGDFQVLTTGVDPRFLDTKNRPTLVQTFEENSTGFRFTVAVNHLKSKGSDCNDVGDPDVGDGQGNCNLTRLTAAQALVDWLATDPTGSGDPDFIIMGDLNSYAMEDPIDAIKAGPDDTAGTEDDYTNLIFDYLGMYAYSYVFDGQNGYLDQALANGSMAAQVTGVADWHINADEPDVLDYDTSFKPPAQDALYEPNAYRTSDHDAVLVGLNLTNQAPSVDAGGPYATNVNTSVMVSATGSDPEGKALTYAWDLDYDGTFETAGQQVTYQAGSAPGIFTIAVQVTDIGGLTATDEAKVAVYDMNDGFITGGGWISSPAGAYLADPTMTGKGEFKFDAKYVRNASVPTGTVSYMIKNANLYFTATGYDWLVVDGNSAWLRGTGNFNGADGFRFMVTVLDEPDAFRIQIWDSSGSLVYDNQPGDLEYNPATTPLGGGKIMVH